MNSPWLSVVLLTLALVAVGFTLLTNRNLTRRQRTVNTGIVVLCAGGVGLSLPRALGITSPEVQSTAVVFSVCCTLVGFFFLLRHRNA
jgi:hypothetical protein